MPAQGVTMENNFTLIDMDTWERADGHHIKLL